MQFRTIVELPPCAFELTSQSKVVLVGSCFAQHVGERLAEALPEGAVDVNAAGVLYNPLSIAGIIDGLLPGAAAWNDRIYFEGRDGLWHSYLHASAFSARSREDCMAKVEARRRSARELLDNADLLVVTFGTDHAYFLKDESPPLGAAMPVGNCHKEPAARFCERRVGMAEMLAAWRPLLLHLRTKAQPARVVLTVSPFRYAKYGFHASAVSKGRLLAFCDALCEEFPEAAYFPAYEIVTDELRDYRFYDRDMLHPSQQAIDYVWQRFKEWCFTPQLSAEAEVRRRAARRAAHRQIIE